VAKDSTVGVIVIGILAVIIVGLTLRYGNSSTALAGDATALGGTAFNDLTLSNATNYPYEGPTNR